MIVSPISQRRKRDAALVAGEGIPHDGLLARPVDEDGEAVAAAEKRPALAAAPWRGEGRGRDAVPLAHRGGEDGRTAYADFFLEEAE